MAMGVPVAREDAPLYMARCKQGRVILTRERVWTELRGVGGRLTRSQSLPLASVTSVQVSRSPSLLGLGGSVSLVVCGVGAERLHVTWITPKATGEAIYQYLQGRLTT